jgi:hypothetical protein
MSDQPATDGAAGLALLLDRLWGQEATHKLVLAELFRRTDLANRLGLWSNDDRPEVAIEPGRGIFDLALFRDRAIVVAIELKFGAQSGQDQRDRQLKWAEDANARRAYILLGTSFFEIPRDDGVLYIGVPDLLTAMCSLAAEEAVGELARAYASRLSQDASAWTGDHDPEAATGVAILRLYGEIGATWPVHARSYRATNRSGPDWILNPDAWTTVDIPGWEAAQFYWEIAGGQVRFKLEWKGDPSVRNMARDAYLHALGIAAREASVEIQRSVRRPGRWMTAAKLPGVVTELVLVEGRVDPDRARKLYDDADAVFSRAVDNLAPLLTSASTLGSSRAE